MNKFVEVHTFIDVNKYSWWSSHRGKSVGRVLHYLACYLGYNLAIEALVTDKSVYLNGKRIAYIQWREGYPFFIFCKDFNNKSLGESNQDYYLSLPLTGELYVSSRTKSLG